MTTQTIKAWLTSPQYAEPGDECNPEKLTFTNHNMADVGWLERKVDAQAEEDIQQAIFNYMEN